MAGEVEADRRELEKDTAEKTLRDNVIWMCYRPVHGRKLSDSREGHRMRARLRFGNGANGNWGFMKRNPKVK